MIHYSLTHHPNLERPPPLAQLLLQYINRPLCILSEINPTRAPHVSQYLIMPLVYISLSTDLRIKSQTPNEDFHRLETFYLPCPIYSSQCLALLFDPHETSFNSSKAILLTSGLYTCSSLYLKFYFSLPPHSHLALAKHGSIISSGGLPCCPQIRLGHLNICLPGAL